MSRPDVPGLHYAVQAIYGQPWLTHPQPWIDAAFLGFGALGVVLAARGIGMSAARRRFMLGIAVALLAGVPAISWAISQWRPIMNGKTLLPLAPVFLVFVGIACARLGRPGMVAASALAALQLWACRTALTDRPDEAVPAIVTRLQAEAEPGDRIYLAGPSSRSCSTTTAGRATAWR